MTFFIELTSAHDRKKVAVNMALIEGVRPGDTGEGGSVIVSTGMVDWRVVETLDEIRSLMPSALWVKSK